MNPNRSTLPHTGLGLRELSDHLGPYLDFHGVEGVDSLLQMHDINVQELLIVAAARNKVDLMEYLVEEKGAKVNCSSWIASGKDLAFRKKTTPLIEAVGNGNGKIAALQWLLRHGANANDVQVSETADLQVPAIWGAAERGNIRLCHLLLEHGADPNVYKSNTRNTPLLVAAQNGHRNVVSLLLRAKADVNLTFRPDGRTALSMAVASGRPHVIAALLSAGASLDATDVRHAALFTKTTGKIRSDVFRPKITPLEIEQMGLLLEDGVRQVLENREIAPHYKRAQALERKGRLREALTELVNAQIKLYKTSSGKSRKATSSSPVWTQLELDTERLKEDVYGVAGSDGLMAQWNRHEWYSHDIQPDKLKGYAWAIHGNTLYRHGGMGLGVGLQATLAHLGKDVTWAMDLTTKVWREVPIAKGSCSPGKREDHNGVVYKDAFYVFGGCNSSGRVDNKMFRLDLKPGMMSWSLVKPKGGIRPSGRFGSSMIVLGHKFYMFGGANDQNELLCDLWFFDLKNLRWNELRPRRDSVGVQPVARHMHAMWSHSNKLYIFGGCRFRRGSTDWLTGIISTTELQSFDLETREWEDIKCVGTEPWPTSEYTVLPLFQRAGDDAGAADNGDTSLKDPSTILIFGGYSEHHGSGNELDLKLAALRRRVSGKQKEKLGELGLPYRRTFYRLDMSTRCWTQLEPLRDVSVIPTAQCWAYEIPRKQWALEGVGGENEMPTLKVVIGGGYGLTARSLQKTGRMPELPGLSNAQSYTPEISNEVYEVELGDVCNRMSTFVESTVNGDGWAWTFYDRSKIASPEFRLYPGALDLYRQYDCSDDDWREPPSQNGEPLPFKPDNEKIALGRRVELQGLKAKPALNGCIGRCGRWISETGRYEIYLSLLTRKQLHAAPAIAVKPVNLKYARPLDIKSVSDDLAKASTMCDSFPTPHVSGIWVNLPGAKRNSAFAIEDGENVVSTPFDAQGMCMDTYRGPFSGRARAVCQHVGAKKGVDNCIFLARLPKATMLKQVKEGDTDAKANLAKLKYYEDFLRLLQKEDGLKVKKWTKKTISSRQEHDWPRLLSVRICLDSTQPTVERTILVSPHVSLHSFHLQVLCPAIGWEPNVHAYAFRKAFYRGEDDENVTRPSCLEGIQKIHEESCWVGPVKSTALDMFWQPLYVGGAMADDTKILLGDMYDFDSEACALQYVHDFGDWWSHTLTMRVAEEEQPEVSVAHIVSGRHMCPPMDVGGATEYMLKMHKVAGDSPISNKDITCEDEKDPFTQREDPSTSRWWQFLNQEFRGKTGMKTTMLYTFDFDLAAHQEALDHQLRRRLDKRGTEENNQRFFPTAHGFCTTGAGPGGASPQTKKPNTKRSNYCAVCGVTAGLLVCSGCSTVAFCSREHQLEYWPVHRAECKEAQKKKRAVGKKR